MYFLPPTPLVPNSPYPLLHYQEFLAANTDSESIATQFYDILSSNKWQAQWIFRYGQTQRSHYHSQAHECMVVLSGSAIIRFGVADTVEDMDENTYGSGKEGGSIELRVNTGDVLIIPVGVAHKTFSAELAAMFQRLSPGDGHSVPSDFREQLHSIELTGFIMMGSYPVAGGAWDFAVGGEGAAAYASVWSIPPPELDPMLGTSEEGLCSLWDLKGPRVRSNL